MPLTATQIDRFESFEFAAQTAEGTDISHTVYRRGTGPAVVLIQELPGIGQATLRLADILVDAGFQVVMPHLFGPIGRTRVARNFVQVFCMRREFSLFAANKSSPIVDWLKALCRRAKEDCNAAGEMAQGVGVIGMCLTGNFAISLMADDSVLAAVASQPAMPLLKQGALHMSADDVAAVSKRIDATAPVKAFRFEKDPLSTARKFTCFNEAFNTATEERVELNVLPGNGHSVFTLDFVDEVGNPTRTALDDILAYFTRQLVS